MSDAMGMRLPCDYIDVFVMLYSRQDVLTVHVLYCKINLCI